MKPMAPFFRPLSLELAGGEAPAAMLSLSMP